MDEWPFYTGHEYLALRSVDNRRWHTSSVNGDRLNSRPSVSDVEIPKPYVVPGDAQEPGDAGHNSWFARK